MTDGVILLFPNDVDALASFLGETKRIVAQKYLQVRSVEYDFTTYPSDPHEKPIYLDTLTLKFEGSKDCIFFEKVNGKNNCRIYSARPSQCKRYPLLSFVLTSNGQLKFVQSDCPGISLDFDNDKRSPSGEKKKYSPTELRSLIQEDQENEYNYYTLLKKHRFDIKAVYPFLRMKK